VIPIVSYKNGKGEVKMKKYTSCAAKWLMAAALIFGAVFLVGIILLFAGIPTLSFAMIIFGGLPGILFLLCFLAEKSRVLIIDNEKIVFPRGAVQNGKTVRQKTAVKFCDITSIDYKLIKGDGIFVKDAYFYTIKIKGGTKITVTLYEYGKHAENEIFETIKDRIVKG